jgi:uncharacterized protein (DUF488 family)
MAVAERTGDDPAILTEGHSTRPLAEFIALLTAHGVKELVDVRTVPRSRHNPQFNLDALPAPLATAGIAYEHVAGLGGFRRTSPDSVNTGWRNASFRGFADYMQTPEFEAELLALIERSMHGRLAVMCAEAVPWRCHRSLIADALLAHHVPVAELSSATRVTARKMTSFARVRGTRVTYPPEAATRVPARKAASRTGARSKRPKKH